MRFPEIAVWLAPTGPGDVPARSVDALGTPDLGAAGAPPTDRRQQIQFATENGTRIIWVLDPDLTL